MLVIFVGLFQRDRDHVKNVRRSLENVVHFLKRTEACFREEEVDRGNHDGVAKDKSQRWFKVWEVRRCS